MSLPAHIAVNAVFLQPRTGGHETVVRRLLPELRNALPNTRISVFVGQHGREALPGVHARGRAKRIERATLRPALRRARGGLHLRGDTPRSRCALSPR